MMMGKALMGALADRGPLRVLPDIGSPLRGGFYVGQMKVGTSVFALIVAPKASGQASLAFKTSSTATVGTTSVSAGAANTAAMIAAGAASHPAAQFCVGLSIGGYTDWLLPAQDQLELCYRNLKPGTDSNDTASGANANSVPTRATYSGSAPVQTSAVPFQFDFPTQAGGPEMFSRDVAHWSSTGPTSGAGAGQAYRQSFINGAQSLVDKQAVLYVRAVRMVEYIG